MWKRKKKNGYALFCRWGGHFFFLSKKGYLFSFGSNGKLQLGHGHSKDCAMPTRVDFFLPNTIVDVSPGDAHTLFLLKNGEALACGENWDGRCGMRSPEQLARIELVGKNIFQSKAKQVSSGYFSSYFLLQNGVAFACGFNSSGELGIVRNERNRRRTSVYEPTKVNMNEKITSIHAGCGFVAMLTAKGPYFAGTNSSGKCCHPPGINDLRVPSRVKFFEERNLKIENIMLASHSVLFLTNKNVYVCGSDSDGFLGLDKEKHESVYTPHVSPKFSKAKRISCGSTFNCYLDKSRRVFYTGIHKVFSTIGDQSKEIKFFRGKNIVDIHIGRYESFFLDSRGKLYHFGHVASKVNLFKEKEKKKKGKQSRYNNEIIDLIEPTSVFLDIRSVGIFLEEKKERLTFMSGQFGILSFLVYC